MDRRSLPLTLVFGSILQGCPWLGPCDAQERTYTVSLSQEELDGLMGSVSLGSPRIADSDSDTDGSWDTDGAADSDAPGDSDPVLDSDDQDGSVDPSGLSCTDVCELEGYWGEVVDCEGATPEPGDVIAASCTVLDYCIGGRLHEVVATPTRARGVNATARRLAQMAHDEWASVAAFRALAQELRAHGAPSELIRRVLEAAGDEVEHARAVAALATARGGVVPALRTGEVPLRSLEAIAKENVEEAIVVETWSALRAHVQARTASDPEVRDVMVRIAVDETRHAELARDLDRWLRDQLDAGAGERLDRARDAAVAGLRARIEAEATPEETRRAIGEPTGERALLLLEGLAASVWR